MPFAATKIEHQAISVDTKGQESLCKSVPMSNASKKAIMLYRHSLQPGKPFVPNHGEEQARSNSLDNLQRRMLLLQTQPFVSVCNWRTLGKPRLGRESGRIFQNPAGRHDIGARPGRTWGGSDFDGRHLSDGVGVQHNLVVTNILTPVTCSFNGAKNAFQAFHKEFHADMVVVVIGCGPVALCSIAAALEFKPRLIYAVDSVPARLERAKALGAIPVDFKTQDVKQEILSVTDGRGADAVIEVVGHPDALRTAYDIVRLGGKISVIGLHTRPLPFTGDEAYQKNIHIQFGRCPVRSVFNDALASLVRNKDKFKGFVDVTLSGIDQRCVDALHRFEKNEHFKVVIKPSGQDVTVDWTS